MVSFSCVPVPCAFIYPIPDLSIPASLIACSIAEIRSGITGDVSLAASKDHPAPAISASTRALRFLACSRLSNTSIAPPSPYTKPFRLRSKGRQTPAPLASAPILAVAAIASGVTLAPAPPANITSASPDRIIRRAVPIESFPLAQALLTVVLIPFAPNSSPTCEGTMLALY